MGTSYYLKTDEPILVTDSDTTELHIGKSSAGWHFSLHVYPEQSMNDWLDWMLVILYVLKTESGRIENEFGEVISFAHLYEVVTNRKGRGTEDCSEDFLSFNHAERGLAGLLMHKVDGKFCIGHSEGTYDYIVGDFS